MNRPRSSWWARLDEIQAAADASTTVEGVLDKLGNGLSRGTLKVICAEHSIELPFNQSALSRERRQKAYDALVAAGEFGHCRACGTPLPRPGRAFCSTKCSNSTLYNPRTGTASRSCVVCGAACNSTQTSGCTDACIAIRLQRRFEQRKTAFEAHLTRDSTLKSGRVRLGLIEFRIKEAVCEWCGISEWRGQPAPLTCDHINGINTDNRVENLRILCANCHSQTDTFCGRNIGNPLRSL